MERIRRFVVWGRANRLKAKLVVLAGLWLIIILMFVVVKLFHWNEIWWPFSGGPGGDMLYDRSGVN